MGIHLKEELATRLRHATRANLDVFKGKVAALSLIKRNRSVGGKIRSSQVHVLATPAARYHQPEQEA
jgi:ubiquinone biosynthesis protein UbiJ